MLTDTTAIVRNFGVNNLNISNYRSAINPLIHHYTIITSPGLLVPGAGSHRILHLKKQPRHLSSCRNSKESPIHLT
jgi:hypothetical protein